jgi:hypothetical protein
MPDIKDWHAHIALEESKKREAKQREQMAVVPRMREVSTKAQMVLDHPGWQHFADLIETRIQEIDVRRAATTKKMIFGTAMGHELELLKIELNVMDAEIAGLRYAASLMPDAVVIGQQIAGEMSRAAAGRADA